MRYNIEKEKIAKEYWYNLAYKDNMIMKKKLEDAERETKQVKRQLAETKEKLYDKDFEIEELKKEIDYLNNLIDNLE